MNENVGASFGLSVLTVVFFAVVLYQPDTPPPLASVPAIAPAEPVDARPPGPPLKPTPVGKPAEGGEPEAVAVVRRPEAPASPPKAEPDEPRGEFTMVREGETLADVAGRVYGSADASKALWLSNRDRLDGPDAPVAAGSILRTP